MKDKSKILTVVNTGEKPSPGSAATRELVHLKSAGTPVNMSDYLLKAIWEKVFEVRATESGEEYLFCKVNWVSQYGITTYTDGKDLDLPGIYDGLPIDNQTLYWEEIQIEAGTDAEGNPVYETSKVLKAKGGGSGEGGGIEYPLTWSGYSSGTWDGSKKQNIYIPSKVSELSNDSLFINLSDLDFYIEQGGYITSSALNGYATESYVTSRGYITVSSLDGYATESWVKNQGYALASALGNYLPLAGGTINGNLTVNGVFNAKGTKAYMPTGSDGRGFAFAGQYMYVHWDYSSWERIFHLDGNNCGIFAKLPQVIGLGYLADRSWVGQNYLSLSGGSLSGALSVNSSSADIITVKRTNTGGGAFVSYKGMNQSNLGWGAGASSGHEFVWMYYTDGSLANGAIHMTLDKNANLTVKGGVTMYGTSDKRLKQNIRTFGASEELMKLGGVYQFEYIEEEIKCNEKYKGTHFGLIYQNVKESSLSKMCIEREDGFGALNYLDTSFISLLAAVGMEHEKRLQILERENIELRMEVEQLKNK